MTLKYKLFLSSIVLACIYFDVARNSTLVILFAGENDGTIGYLVNSSSWICAAVVLALLPVALDGKVAMRAALLSGIFSVCAVLMSHYTTEAQDEAKFNSKNFHYSEQLRLAEKLAKCDTQPAHVCSSRDTQDEIKKNAAKLAQLESTATLKVHEVVLFGFTINPPKLFNLICLLLVSVAIPYFSASVAFKVKIASASTNPKAAPKKQTVPPQAAVNNDSTVRKYEKPRANSTRKSSKTGDITHGDQVRKLEKAYSDLKKRGQRVNRDSLRIEAGVSASAASEWWKIKRSESKNIVPIGKVKK